MGFCANIRIYLAVLTRKKIGCYLYLAKKNLARLVLLFAVFRRFVNFALVILF
jgi:hypothetical protein